jgi:hypothetical protein
MASVWHCVLDYCKNPFWLLLILFSWQLRSNQLGLMAMWNLKTHPHLHILSPTEVNTYLVHWIAFSPTPGFVTSCTAALLRSTDLPNIGTLERMDHGWATCGNKALTHTLAASLGNQVIIHRHSPGSQPVYQSSCWNSDCRLLCAVTGPGSQKISPVTIDPNGQVCINDGQLPIFIPACNLGPTRERQIRSPSIPQEVLLIQGPSSNSPSWGPPSSHPGAPFPPH